MRMRLGTAALAGVLLAGPAGCALMQPLPAQHPAALAVKQQQVDEALAKVSALLAEARTPQEGPATQKRAEAEALALLAGVLQQLRIDLQAAPSVQAQQQAALQAAQSAAVTFGGPYGALIAAGLGIVGVLVQGVLNTNKAHQAAKVANETAQVLAGRMPLTGR